MGESEQEEDAARCEEAGGISGEEEEETSEVDGGIEVEVIEVEAIEVGVNNLSIVVIMMRRRAYSVREERDDWVERLDGHAIDNQI